MTPTRAAMTVLTLAISISTGGLAGLAARSQPQRPFNDQLVGAFTYRNLGPFRMGARTSDIAVARV